MAKAKKGIFTRIKEKIKEILSSIWDKLPHPIQRFRENLANEISKINSARGPGKMTVQQAQAKESVVHKGEKKPDMDVITLDVSTPREVRDELDKLRQQVDQTKQSVGIMLGDKDKLIIDYNEEFGGCDYTLLDKTNGERTLIHGRLQSEMRGEGEDLVLFMERGLLEKVYELCEKGYFEDIEIERMNELENIIQEVTKTGLSQNIELADGNALLLDAKVLGDETRVKISLLDRENDKLEFLAHHRLEERDGETGLVSIGDPNEAYKIFAEIGRYDDSEVELEDEPNVDSKSENITEKRSTRELIVSKINNTIESHSSGNIELPNGKFMIFNPVSQERGNDVEVVCDVTIYDAATGQSTSLIEKQNQIDNASSVVIADVDKICRIYDDLSKQEQIHLGKEDKLESSKNIDDVITEHSVEKSADDHSKSEKSKRKNCLELV